MQPYTQHACISPGVSKFRTCPLLAIKISKKEMPGWGRNSWHAPGRSSFPGWRASSGASARAGGQRGETGLCASRPSGNWIRAQSSTPRAAHHNAPAHARAASARTCGTAILPAACMQNSSDSPEVLVVMLCYITPRCSWQAARCVCRQAAGKGCRISSRYWVCQIPARDQNPTGAVLGIGTNPRQAGLSRKPGLNSLRMLLLESGSSGSRTSGVTAQHKQMTSRLMRLVQRASIQFFDI